MDPPALDLILTVTGLGIALLALGLDLVRERRARRDADIRARKSEEELALLRVTKESADRAVRLVEQLVEKNLRSLQPAFRAALTQHIVQAFVSRGVGATVEDVLSHLAKDDPALEAAWTAVEADKGKREAFIDGILKTLRERDFIEHGVLRIGGASIPFGRPVRLAERPLPPGANLVAHPAFVWIRRLVGLSLIVTLGVLVLFSLAQFVDVGSWYFPVLLVTLGPIYWAVYSAESGVRQGLARDPEYGVFFEPGTIGSGPSYVQFGEYAWGAYYAAPGQSGPSGSASERLGWRRFSPNGRKRWDHALDPEREIADQVYWVK
jgi:hypothetical protein